MKTLWQFAIAGDTRVDVMEGGGRGGGGGADSKSEEGQHQSSGALKFEQETCMYNT